MHKLRRIKLFVLTIFALGSCYFATVGSLAEEIGNIDDKAIFKSFVERAETNLPIAGEFTLTHVSDLGRWIEIRDHEERQAPGRVVMEPPASVLRCRWSRTPTIETLETLSKSDIWRSFYRYPGGMLDGNSSTHFNLIANRTPAAIRPENFYFQVGSLSWREFLERGEVKQIRRDELFETLHDMQAFQLIITIEREVATLTIDEKSRLWRAKVANNAVAVELEIQKFTEHDDGRFFPAAATNRMRDLRTGKVLRENTFVADKLDFLPQEDADRVAKEMKLPAGCEIYDLQKKKKLTLKESVSASKVAKGEGTWEPY